MCKRSHAFCNAHCQDGAVRETKIKLRHGDTLLINTLGGSVGLGYLRRFLAGGFQVCVMHVTICVLCVCVCAYKLRVRAAGGMGCLRRFLAGGFQVSSVCAECGLHAGSIGSTRGRQWLPGVWPVLGVLTQGLRQLPSPRMHAGPPAV